LNKKKLTVRIGDFLSGKGFYIVLLVCIAIIGASAWVLFLADRPDEEAITPAIATTEDETFGISSPIPTVTATPAPAAKTTPPVSKTTPKPTPEVSNTPALAVTQAPTPAETAAPTPAATETPASTETEHSGEQVAATINDLTFIAPIVGTETKYYSDTELQKSATMGDWRAHLGIDYEAAIGTAVQTVAEGKVTEVRHDDLLGVTVTIDHGFGLTSVYANLADNPPVEVGQNIPLGAAVGEIGNTAISESADAPHLHFEMRRDGVRIDPHEYLPST